MFPTIVTLRKTPVVFTVLALLAGGSGMALAHHDPGIVHGCIKNGHLEIVSSPSDCKVTWTAVTFATESALTDLQESNTNLRDRLEALETLTRRLHGNKAAVIKGASGSESAGEPGGYIIRLLFCEFEPFSECDEDTAFALETDLLTEADEDTIITFDASNSQMFDLIAEQLTNGVNELLELKIEYFLGDGSFGGSLSLFPTEKDWFFGAADSPFEPQVSADTRFVDLEGLEIGSIQISVERLVQFFDSTEMRTNRQIAFRVFFGLAD